MENVVHHPLEGHGWVCESEEHDGWLKESSIHVEGGFFLVAFLDSDVVISPTDIKLCEVFGAAELVDEFRDEQKRVSGFDRHFIELPIILYGSKCSIFLFDEEEGGGERGFQGTDPSGFQVFVKEPIKLFLLVSVQGVDLAVQSGFRVWDELYGMVPRFSFGEFVEVFFGE